MSNKILTDCRNFIVISHARSGSNLLIDCLQNNPNIIAYDELFAGHNRTDKKDFDSIKTELFSESKSKECLVGCKIFYYHLTEQEWSSLADMSSLKIIHLKRRNILRTLTSMKIAFKTKKWGTTEVKDKAISVSEKIVDFNCDNLIKRIIEIESWQLETEKRFKNQKIHDIYYEDMISNPDLTMDDLSAFLELESKICFSSKLRKQNPEPLADLIKNYQEVSDRLEGTRWQAFLD